LTAKGFNPALWKKDLLDGNPELAIQAINPHNDLDTTLRGDFIILRERGEGNTLFVKPFLELG